MQEPRGMKDETEEKGVKAQRFRGAQRQSEAGDNARQNILIEKAELEDTGRRQASKIVITYTTVVLQD